MLNVLTECYSGDHNIRKSSESNTLRTKALEPFLVHDQYKESKHEVIYDFTLLRLSERVNFNTYPHIRPICLPDSSFQENNQDIVTVVGWGYTQVDESVSGNLIRGIDSSPADVLQKLDIR